MTFTSGARADHHRARSAAPRPGARRRLAMLAVAASSVTGVLALPAIAAAAPAAPTSPRSAAAAPAGRSYDAAATQATFALTLLREFDVDRSPATFEAYAAQRDRVAIMIAERLGLEGDAMVAAWAHADTTHQHALLAALTQLGVSYRRNTSKESEGFDCSGLTTYAWGQAGVTLARQSGSQIRAAAPRTLESAQAGDLVYYPGHVMMFLGVGNFIVHAPYTGRNVEVDHAPSKRSLKVGNPIG